MKERQPVKRILFSMTAILLGVLIVTPVLAGGWAEITMDQLPGEIHAGESIHMSFIVRQHGETPVHYLTEWDQPVVPIISATNEKTGETVEFTAVPDKREVGRFYADVTFSSEGEWSWTIAPNPLVGTTEFTPLTILPAVAAAVSEADLASEAPPIISPMAGMVGAGVILVVVFLVGIGLVISRRKGRPEIIVSGD